MGRPIDGDDERGAVTCRSDEPPACHGNDVAYIGRHNGAGLFYAACSDDYDEDICGCPLCRQAAHHGR